MKKKNVGQNSTVICPCLYFILKMGYAAIT